MGKVIQVFIIDIIMKQRYLSIYDIDMSKYVKEQHFKNSIDKVSISKRKYAYCN